MKDFKRLHRSNWPAPDKHPSFLEMVGIAAIAVGSVYGLGYYALVQATGGF